MYGLLMTFSRTLHRGDASDRTTACATATGSDGQATSTTVFETLSTSQVLDFIALSHSGSRDRGGLLVAVTFDGRDGGIVV
jgi:hypothetical protein